MCKYCKLVSGETKSMNKYENLFISRHCNTYFIECDDDEIEINYCPMCGRKLGESNE